MKKRTKSFKELVNENKKQLIDDIEQMEKIEMRLENRNIQKAK
jgi:hypothetical protein